MRFVPRLMLPSSWSWNLHRGAFPEMRVIYLILHLNPCTVLSGFLYLNLLSTFYVIVIAGIFDAVKKSHRYRVTRLTIIKYELKPSMLVIVCPDSVLTLLSDPLTKLKSMRKWWMATPSGIVSSSFAGSLYDSFCDGNAGSNFCCLCLCSAVRLCGCLLILCGRYDPHLYNGLRLIFFSIHITCLCISSITSSPAWASQPCHKLLRQALLSFLMDVGMNVCGL